MARYDYRCTSCGNTFEVEHPMSERPDVACPTCGARAERVFSPSGIRFVGHGFYNTDQRDKAPSKPSGESKSSESHCANCPHKKD